MQDAFASEHWTTLFEKPSAKLLAVVDLKDMSVKLSVVIIKTFHETVFDNMADAAAHYNLLP